jgi:two-component system cell cycle sensor histidine kinase PleC
MLRRLENRRWRADTQDLQLGMDQVVLAAANANIAIYVLPLALAGMAVVSLQWTDTATAFLWFVGSLLAAVVLALSYRHISAIKDDAGQLPAARWALWLGNIAVQATLISGAVLFWSPDAPESHLFWLLALAVCQATSMAVLAPCLPVALSTAGLGLAASCLAFATGGTTYTVIGCLGIGLAVALAGVALSLNRTATAMLHLRREQGRLIERLTAANQAKSDFLANMSHELRTPLNAILGFSEIMRDEMMGPLGAAPYKGYSRDIHASGSHLLVLINGILDLAKIDAGRFDLQESDVDLSQIIDEAVRMLTPRADEGGVTIMNNVPANAAIRADATAMRQIALNVAMNAVKFTPAGGTVRIFGTAIPDGRVAIAVQDTGCGIRKEDLEGVFETFGQGRHDLAVREKGTGLGLPIVRGLMRAHGGDALIESEVGRGTTVYLALPRERVLNTGLALGQQHRSPRAA